MIYNQVMNIAWSAVIVELLFEQSRRFREVPVHWMRSAARVVCSGIDVTCAGSGSSGGRAGATER